MLKQTIIPLKHNGLSLFLSRTNAVNCYNSNNTSSNIKQYPDILLIHGLTYSSHEFDVKYKDYSLVDFLAKRGARVWLLDMSGYGRSEKLKNGFMLDGQYAAEDIASAVSLIRKKERVTKVTLLGWSFGAVASALMAQKNPDWINKLILYAPLYYGKGKLAPLEDYHRFIPDNVMDDFQKDINGKIDFTVTEPGVVKTYLAQCSKYDKNGSPNGGRKYDNQPKTVNLFSPQLLTMPVLLLGGSTDPIINYSKDLPIVMDQLPNTASKLIEYKGGSHILILEKSYYHQFQHDIWNFII
jgi:pimeloyl-ACP methyl ester carboxylesterase